MDMGDRIKLHVGWKEVATYCTTRGADGLETGVGSGGVAVGDGRGSFIVGGEGDGDVARGGGEENRPLGGGDDPPAPMSPPHSGVAPQRTPGDAGHHASA
eukprot:scaffold3635_cov31-Tisochrysis_lutea.AAC.2